MRVSAPPPPPPPTRTQTPVPPKIQELLMFRPYTRDRPLGALREQNQPITPPPPPPPPDTLTEKRSGKIPQNPIIDRKQMGSFKSPLYF